MKASYVAKALSFGMTLLLQLVVFIAAVPLTAEVASLTNQMLVSPVGLMALVREALPPFALLSAYGSVLGAVVDQTVVRLLGWAIAVSTWVWGLEQLGHHNRAQNDVLVGVGALAFMVPVAVGRVYVFGCQRSAREGVD